MLGVAEVLGSIDGFFASPRRVAKDIPVVGALVLDEGFLTLQAAVEALVSAGLLPDMVLVVTCLSEMAVVCSRTFSWEVEKLFFPISSWRLVELLSSTLLGVVRVFFSTIL